MSDLVAFKAMLKRAGIQWEESHYEKAKPITGEKGDTVVVVAPDKKTVVGYPMFFTEFAFAPDGSLRAIGCWE